MARDIFDELSDDKLIALELSGADWPSGLLSRTAIPERWMGLVTTADGRRRLVPAGDDPACEHDDKLLLVRDRPLVLMLTLPDGRSRDRHAVRGQCRLVLRWEADENDLAAMGRGLMHGPRLTRDELAERCAAGGGRDALERFIREHDAAAVVHELDKSALLDVLRDALKRFCFECGARLERIDEAAFESPTLTERERIQRDAARQVERIKSREMVEAAALEATQRRLDDLGTVLDKLKQAAAGDDNNQWHELLPALSPAERGRLLENLWRLTPNHRVAEAVVAVAGKECLWFDPADPDRPTRRVALNESLGGLRSVAFAPDKRLLAVGAATGVWTLSADSDAAATAYAVPDSERQKTGFNAAVVAGGFLYATHSHLGCWRWTLDAPDEASPILRPEGGRPKTIRAVTVAGDGRVFFTGGSKVLFYDPDTDELVEFSAVGDTIHALAILDDDVYVGTADGKLLRTRLDEPRGWSTAHRTLDAIESISVRRWNDLVEMVIPASDEGILGVYADENVTVRLLQSPDPIRRAWACDDVLVGLTRRRDKLAVTNANLPERTARVIPVGQMIGHSVQDACLVIRTLAEEPHAAASSEQGVADVG